MQRLRIIFFACLCSSFVSTFALAAATAPPEPHLRKVPAAWMGLGLMFVFFGIILAISLRSSKRGHQD